MNVDCRCLNAVLKNVLNATDRKKSVGNWTWLYNEKIHGRYILVNTVMKSRANVLEMKV